MGMISRVRGRVRSDSFSKIDPRLSDEKLANTVWLLSLVLLLPYWTPRALLIALGGFWLLAAYSCLVLPLLISANYKYPARWYPVLLKHALGLVQHLHAPGVRVFGFLCAIYAPIARAETLFLQMTNLSTMLSQLLFFVACDRLLITSGPGQRVTCLYSLMFYNVVAYCVAYVRELIEKEDWSPYVNITRNSDVKHLAMTATKIVLEWTKAVTFIITVIFMLLVLGLEQGLENFKPTSFYQVLTGLYYLASEKAFVDIWPGVLSTLHIQRLEGLESLYVPVWTRAVTVMLAAIVAPALIWSGQARLASLLLYVNVWARARHTIATSWKRLTDEQKALDRFRRAAPSELDVLEDVCAVCLGDLKAARVTPCQHYFHADCLRRCLAASDKCPICVRQFIFC